MTTISTTPNRQLSTPDIAPGTASVEIYASTRIKAPASLVFRTLRNSETWKDWNQWIPKVEISSQPPPGKDDITANEISELVRNTSIAGSVDSEIIDGAVNGPITPKSTGVGGEMEGFIAPPVTRQRLASNASRTSSTASGGPRKESNGLSGAQKYAAAQAARKGSVASSTFSNSSESSAPAVAPAAASAAAPGNILVEIPDSNSGLMAPAPGNTSGANALTAAQRRKSSLSVVQKRSLSINALYGEPSVRIQNGTKMTFHLRMGLPMSPRLDKEISVIVIEVSRPDDENEFGDMGGAMGSMSEVTSDTGVGGRPPIHRSSTHNLSRTGVYRLVWSLGSSYGSSNKGFPKFMLTAQRVMEMRPVISGDGKEECVYEDWEMQKGVLAKGVKKQYGEYLQTRFVNWGKGLGEFCETLGGAVERKDFVEG